MWPFKLFLIVHAVAGGTGLLLFWVPVLSRKGAQAHRYWGRLFCALMLVTASMAASMGCCTLLAPRATHPHLAMPPALIAGVFGWMMLYLAVLTVSLVWHGQRSTRTRHAPPERRAPLDLAVQGLVLLLAVQCARVGWQLHMPLMLAMPVIGVASVATNFWYVFRPAPHNKAWLMEHVKALVGAGISVYTAFTAFGAVHLLPSAALNPITWAMPLVAGISLILWHWARIRRSLVPAG